MPDTTEVASFKALRQAILTGHSTSRIERLPGKASMPTKYYKPGETAPQSGQYGVYGPRGGARGREVTSVAGERLPPTQNPGEKYRLVDPTKHEK
jgi:hypothetical protein